MLIHEIFVCLRVYITVNNFSLIKGLLPGFNLSTINWDEVPCSRTQNHAPGEDQTHNLVIESMSLSQLALHNSFIKFLKMLIHEIFVCLRVYITVNNFSLIKGLLPGVNLSTMQLG